MAFDGVREQTLSTLGVKSGEEALRRIEAATLQMDAFTVETATTLSVFYENALRRTVDEYTNRLLNLDDPDPVTMLRARRDLIENPDPFKQTWDRWKDALTRVHRAAAGQADWIAGKGVYPGDPSGDLNNLPSGDPEYLQSLLGLWPETGDRMQDDSFVARYHNMSLTHRETLADITTRYLVAGLDRRQAVEEVQEKLPQYGRYSKGLFHDSTIEMERETIERQAAKAGLEYFIYLGPDDRVTRPFCQRLIDFDSGSFSELVNAPTANAPVEPKTRQEETRDARFGPRDPATGDPRQPPPAPLADEAIFSSNARSFVRGEIPVDQPNFNLDPEQRANRALLVADGRDLWPPMTQVRSLSQGFSKRTQADWSKAAAAEFGLQGARYDALSVQTGRDTAKDQEKIRAAYEETQAYLAEQGAKDVKAYRPIRSRLLVGQAVEEWTLEKPTSGKFITEKIPSNRILGTSTAPDWNGTKGGVLVLSDVPELKWSDSDFRVTSDAMAPGSVNLMSAKEIDPNAISAGQWGIATDPSGSSALFHQGVGRMVLEGQAYKPEDLQRIARQLERGNYLDGLGKPRNPKQWSAAVDMAKLHAGFELPEHSSFGKSIRLRGRALPPVNSGIKASPDKWGKRDIFIREEEGGVFQYKKKKAVVRGPFAIVTEKAGTGEGSFQLIHTATGDKLAEGWRTFYSAGERVPVDVGGWKQAHFKGIAERASEYFDPETGRLIPERRTEFDNLVEELSETWAVYGVDVDKTVDNIFQRAAEYGEDLDDSFDPFDMPIANSAQRAAKATFSDEEDRLPSTRYGADVETRLEGMREGRYTSHAGPYDEIVAAGVAKKLDPNGSHGPDIPDDADEIEARELMRAAAKDAEESGETFDPWDDDGDLDDVPF